MKQKSKITLTHRIYDNPELREAINKKFVSQCERETAWMTVHLIKNLYPETEEILNGKLQEEWEDIEEC